MHFKMIYLLNCMPEMEYILCYFDSYVDFLNWKTPGRQLQPPCRDYLGCFIVHTVILSRRIDARGR